MNMGRPSGEAMYSLARIPAKELGAELLWCNDGSGGLSGVGGDVRSVGDLGLIMVDSN